MYLKAHNIGSVRDLHLVMHVIKGSAYKSSCELLSTFLSKSFHSSTNHMHTKDPFGRILIGMYSKAHNLVCVYCLPLVMHLIRGYAHKSSCELLSTFLSKSFHRSPNHMHTKDPVEGY